MSGSASPTWLGGTPADWVEAIGTAGAFFFAVGLLARELWHRRTAEARRVSAWAVKVTPSRRETDLGVSIGDRAGSSILVRARNGGETPVYDFQVQVITSYAPDAGSMGSQGQTLPPGEHEVWVDMVRLPEGGLAGMPYVDISFVDAGQRRWQRLHDGRFGRDRISLEGRSRSLRWCLWWRWERWRIMRQLGRDQTKLMATGATEQD